MKIAYCSDLHLEFGNLELKNTEGADVLILAGDIFVSADLYPYKPSALDGFMDFRSARFHEFMKNACEQFPFVLMVMGNHEHYHGDFAKTADNIRNCFSWLNNFHLLENELIKIDDVTFICGTMWTDMNESDSTTLLHVSEMMGDFRLVSNSNHMVSYKVCDRNSEFHSVKFKERPAKFTPEDAVTEFKKFTQYLKICLDEVVKQNDKVVVVTHHAPSFKSIHSDYVNDTIMNGAYSSALDEFIESKPSIKKWIHGHIHQVQDYMIGETRVLANPRGYIGHEYCADDFQLKYFEV